MADRLHCDSCCTHDTATARSTTQQRRTAPLLRAIALSCLLLLSAPIVALAASAAPASAAAPAVAVPTPAPSPVTATAAAPAVDEHSLLDDLDPEEFEAARPFLVELEQTGSDASQTDDTADAPEPSAVATDASTPHTLAAEPAVTAAVLETGALASCLTFLSSFFVSPDDSSSMPPRSARRIGGAAASSTASSGSSWLSSLSQTVTTASWPSLLAAGAAATLGLGALLWLLSSDSDSNPCARSSRRSTASKRGVARRDEPQPLLIELPPGHRRGRVQGMDWVAKSLKRDQDGDEAHEFLGPF